jgi:hypothetical protein
MRGRPQVATLMIAVASIIFALHGSDAAAPDATFRRQDSRVERVRDADHRYRIVGKVRLFVFWVSANDVGGARITWSGGDEARSVALLIGSEPERAPRGVNEWGYIRENVADNSTTVFGIRTVTDGDSPEEAEARRTSPGESAELGVLCSTVSSIDTESQTATVHVNRQATYRDLGRVFDVVERHARWNGRRTVRPADVEPGFLTALDLMMRSSAAAVREPETAPKCPRLAYVYKDAVYDLIPRRIERVPQLRTPSGVFHNLLRTEIAVRNRATGSSSRFVITYGTEGALWGVPVTAQYQPNWWFKVELELDDDLDVPSDPSSDISLRRRIDALCAALNE